MAPMSRVMAVVKANGYGHGAVNVAKALTGSDGFAVARLDEALALRAAGVTHRILLLEGVFSQDQLSIAVQQRLEVMFHTFEQLQLLERRDGTEPLTAWLKVDSGMNRLGFRVQEVGEAYARLTRSARIQPLPTLVTHLANADNRSDPMTSEQLRSFSRATAGIVGARSIANSAAILAYPELCADWVRPGLMLYGLSPFPDRIGEDFDLRPVMTLQTEVIAVKTLQAGETVGYGSTWSADRETSIAVIAAGYGDGYPCSVRSGAPLLVNGCRARLCGRVSMDMITADVTDLRSVKSGDPVILWGDAIPVEEVARHAGTIPYELICGVSPRVQRDVI